MNCPQAAQVKGKQAMLRVINCFGEHSDCMLPKAGLQCTPKRRGNVLLLRDFHLACCFSYNTQLKFD